MMVSMTQTIINRVSSHPNDRLDWGQTDECGYDFLSLAASEGVLNNLYPLVKDQPYYVSASTPLTLTFVPDDDDLDEMCASDRSAFQISEEGYSRTLHETILSNAPDMNLVARCVAGGADLLYQPAHVHCHVGARCSSSPTLHHCILKGYVEVVTALLKTSKDIDFTVKDTYEHSPLHCVCRKFTSDPPRSPELMGKLTAAIASRLLTHPCDTVDWGQKDEENLDFLGLAAREGVLSCL